MDGELKKFIDIHFFFLTILLFLRLPAYLTVFMGWMLGITYEFRGLENIDTKKGGVTILNHQSGLDLICKHFIDYFQHFND